MTNRFAKRNKDPSQETNQEPLYSFTFAPGMLMHLGFLALFIPLAFESAMAALRTASLENLTGLLLGVAFDVFMAVEAWWWSTVPVHRAAFYKDHFVVSAGARRTMSYQMISHVERTSSRSPFILFGGLLRISTYEATSYVVPAIARNKTTNVDLYSWLSQSIPAGAATLPS